MWKRTLVPVFMVCSIIIITATLANAVQVSGNASKAGTADNSGILVTLDDVMNIPSMEMWGIALLIALISGAFLMMRRYRIGGALACIAFLSLATLVYAAVIAQDTTDSNGDYTLSDVPAGIYSLSFSASGYVSEVIEPFVVSDTNISVSDVELDPVAETQTPTSPPAPTNTPVPPTDTPVPTDTPLPPTNTPVPTDTPIPTETPTPTICPNDGRVYISPASGTLQAGDKLLAQIILEVCADDDLQFVDAAVEYDMAVFDKPVLINDYITQLETDSTQNNDGIFQYSKSSFFGSSWPVTIGSNPIYDLQFVVKQTVSGGTTDMDFEPGFTNFINTGLVTLDVTLDGSSYTIDAPTATETPEPPTNTPVPTDTPVPTNTPEPTNTPNLINCWHLPSSLEACNSSTTMRVPENPTDPTQAVWIHTGIYPVGGADAVTIYYKESSSGIWSSKATGWECNYNSNDYWGEGIPGSTVTTGQTLQYYVKVTKSGMDDTFIYNGNSKTGLESVAQGDPYEITF